MTEPDYEVAIIGAGPGGIATAHMLRQKGIRDFVIIERGNDFGIELRAASLAKKLGRLLMRHRRLVDALAGQGVVDIRDRDDSRGDRNAIAFQTIRIPLAIPSLMMARGNVGAHFKQAIRAATTENGVERTVAQIRMSLDDLPFVVVEPAGFQQYRVRNADLSDVVHGTGQGESIDPRAVDLRMRFAQRHAKQLAIGADAFEMRPRVTVTILGEFREAEDECVASQHFRPPSLGLLMQR